MDNEKLIEYVKEYPLIYDLNDKKYSDKPRKDMAWREISRRLGVNENKCRKSWSLLRDSFRRIVKKQKELQNEGIISNRKWKYEDEMSFLIPHFKDKSYLGEMAIKDEEYDDWSMTLGTEGCIASLEYPPDENIVENSVSSPNMSHTPPPMIHAAKRQRTLSSKNPLTDEMTSASTEQYFHRSVLDDKRIIDDVESFFAAMASTVKSFPLRERAIAKAKVFEVISKMEIDLLS